MRRELAEEPSIHSLLTARSETNAEVDPKSRSAMETEERERRENEKRRVCVSGPCEGLL